MATATTATDSVTRRFAAAFGLLGQYAARTTTAQEGSASSNAQQQLTIFYGGMAVVVDGCKPEKAAELIRLAAAAAAGNKGAPAMVNRPVARKESLRRFLSKRKDRNTATAPAPVPVLVPDSEPEPASKKGKQLVGVSRDEAATWLALGSLGGGMHARC